MKKNTYFLYAAAMAALSLTACSNEEDMTVADKGGTEAIVLTASQGAGTRAILDGLDAKWETGDQLVVWTGTVKMDNKSENLTCTTGGEATGEFAGYIRYTSEPTATTTLTACVKTEAMEVGGTSASIDLSSQAGTANKVLDYDFMWGVTNYKKKSFTFTHNIAVMKYTLTLTGCASTTANIRLAATSGLAGIANFSAGNGLLTSTIDGHVDINDVPVNASGVAEVYVALIPGEYTDLMAIVDVDGKQAKTFVGSNGGNFTVEAGKVYTTSNTVTPTTPVAQVGWYLNADGTKTAAAQANSVAVIFSMQPTPTDFKAGYTNGYAMALDGFYTNSPTNGYKYDFQEEEMSYKEEYIYPAGAWMFDRDGREETMLLKADHSLGLNAAYYAFAYGDTGGGTHRAAPPAGCSIWFLPAAGQWYDILRNLGGLTEEGEYTSMTTANQKWPGKASETLTAINAYISAANSAGATTLSLSAVANNYYWCSTEYNPGMAYVCRMTPNSNVDLAPTYKHYYFRIRPAIAF